MVETGLDPSAAIVSNGDAGVATAEKADDLRDEHATPHRHRSLIRLGRNRLAVSSDFGRISLLVQNAV
jgi:hypothetical protein